MDSCISTPADLRGLPNAKIGTESSFCPLKLVRLTM